jgi:hypothetical protein
MVADDRPSSESEGQDIRQDDESGERPESGELALDGGDDDRLPWLESDDDDGDEGGDGPRILGFAALGFLVLVALIGGIWWITHINPDKTLVADGSTIAAPKMPYKEPPKDAGGKTFEGTGDTAFAVSQGKSDVAGAAMPTPSDSGSAHPGIAIPPPAPSSSGSSAAGAAPGTPGTMVQIGAYKDRAMAEAAWTRVSGHYSALSGQRHVVTEGQADIGTVFRLQVSAGSGDGARSLCGKLKSQGLDCQVK